ncbi:exported hypothetical protein [Vibrio coralliirubri]|nr:exported hypothetical protein [Vibrio coralliirubri]
MKMKMKMKMKIANKAVVLSSVVAATLASASVFAAGTTFPTDTFQWLGKVPTIDNSTEWQFQDPSGSPVVDGVLTVTKEGQFTSNVIKTILVDSTDSYKLATDASMKLVDTNVIIGGIDYSQDTFNDVTVSVNGNDMVRLQDTDLTGFGGFANFEIESKKDLSTSIKAGEGVLATATIVVTAAS